MPFCPSCRFEYREGITRCRDCGVELVAELPPEDAQPPLPTPETELVELCRVRDTNEGDLIQAALREAGIACNLKTHGAITADLARVVDGATSELAIIHVTRNRLDEAREVLATVRSLPFVWPEGMEPAEGDEEDDEGEEGEDESDGFLSHRP